MVGELFKKKREELGKNLRDISETLKIKHDYLKAIEEENFSMLPEEVYVKGYIRKYAELLKIDPESALNAYTQHISSAKSGAKEPFQFKQLQHKGRKLKPSYIIVAAVLILLSIILIVTGIFNSPEEEYSALVPLESSDEITHASDQHGPVTPSNPEVTMQTSPKTDQSSHVLVISANEPTWLHITIDEVNTKELMMYPGDSVKFEAHKGFSLTVGNAGGIKVNFDQEEIKNLGEKGEVIHLELPGV